MEQTQNLLFIRIYSKENLVSYRRNDYYSYVWRKKKNETQCRNENNTNELLMRIFN